MPNYFQKNPTFFPNNLFLIDGRLPSESWWNRPEDRLRFNRVIFSRFNRDAKDSELRTLLGQLPAIPAGIMAFAEEKATDGKGRDRLENTARRRINGLLSGAEVVIVPGVSSDTRQSQAVAAGATFLNST